MNEIVAKARGDDKLVAPKGAPRPQVSRLNRCAREFVAAAFWLYVVIKLFIYDIDLFLASKIAPGHVWLLNYKFFFLIGAVALLLLVTRSRRVLWWLVYIAFYPFVVLFWKLPRLVLKQRSWNLALAFLDASISFFLSLKYSFIVGAAFAVALLVALSCSEATLLWPAIATILALLLVTLVRRFVGVFKRASSLHLMALVSVKAREHILSSCCPEEGVRRLSTDLLDPRQLVKWTTDLQQAVIANRLCLFAARKLRDYQMSGFGFAAHVVSWLFLIILTSVSFAGLNYGLYKIDNVYFHVEPGASFYAFFYYSFSRLGFSSVPDVTAVHVLSQGAAMLEMFLGLCLVALFVSSLMTVRAQKRASEIGEVIGEMEKDGQLIERFIANEYGLTSVEVAMEKLQELKASLVDLIYRISKQLK